jgi:biopolymer transport protein ExbB
MPRSSSVLSLALAIAIAIATATAAPMASAQDASESQRAGSLFELLERVKDGLQAEQQGHAQRERDFISARDDQDRLLAEARATLARKEQESDALEKTYNDNESLIGENGELLAEQLGRLGELFGVVRQVATDTSGQVWDSLTSSQIEPRKELLDRLGRSKALPSTADLEALWYELAHEMAQQGQVVRYRAPVLTTEGKVEERVVVSVGPVTAV